MAVGADTYADDLIALCGGENVFGAGSRSPAARERRYPILDEDEITAAQPEVILLPDEPYAFGARDVAELAALATPASAAGRIHCLDGTLISWYGPRIARAIAEVSALLAEPPGPP
jgi:ABC-type hemin transport system substrate-binding protein